MRICSSAPKSLARRHGGGPALALALLANWSMSFDDTSGSTAWWAVRKTTAAPSGWKTGSSQTGDVQNHKLVWCKDMIYAINRGTNGVHKYVYMQNVV